MVKITFKIYRVHDYDLYTLYNSKVFNFTKLVKQVLTAYAEKRKFYINVPAIDDAGTAGAYKTAQIQFDEEKDYEALSVIERIKPNCRTLFIKKLLRQSLSNFDYFYIDNDGSSQQTYEESAIRPREFHKSNGYTKQVKPKAVRKKNQQKEPQTAQNIHNPAHDPIDYVKGHHMKLETNVPENVYPDINNVHSNESEESVSANDVLMHLGKQPETNRQNVAVNIGETKTQVYKNEPEPNKNSYAGTTGISQTSKPTQTQAQESPEMAAFKAMMNNPEMMQQMQQFMQMQQKMMNGNVPQSETATPVYTDKPRDMGILEMSQNTTADNNVTEDEDDIDDLAGLANQLMNSIGM